MGADVPAYGLWSLVIINSAVLLIFALSFAPPSTPRDWRSFGAFAAFIVALFTEMYGFPLTIYLIAPWLSALIPGVDLMSHDAGHLWWTVFGLGGSPHFGLLHLVSNVAIFGGLIALANAWSALHAAQRTGRMASKGLYGYVRHPQYAAFILIMAGFLLQWPTIPTLLMFPVLVYMYVRLAKREEQESLSAFGEGYRAYMSRTPRFIPKLSRLFAPTKPVS